MLEIKILENLSEKEAFALSKFMSMVEGKGMLYITPRRH